MEKNMRNTSRRHLLAAATGAVAAAAVSEATPAAAQAGPKPIFDVPITTIPIVGEAGVFQVRRIYCIGRHYAALHWEAVDASTLMWEHKDGSSVKAKIVAQVAGRSADDLPWLKFGVITQRGDGLFYGITHVQRINTQGGVTRGACQQAGAYRSVPYSADYVFWRAE